MNAYVIILMMIAFAIAEVLLRILRWYLYLGESFMREWHSIRINLAPERSAGMVLTQPRPTADVTASESALRFQAISCGVTVFFIAT